MSYNIEYGQSEKRNVTGSISAGKNRRLLSLVALFVSIVIGISLLLSDAMRHYLLPGDPIITEQALVSFADEVRSGTAIGEAAYAFCRELLSKDGIA